MMKYRTGEDYGKEELNFDEKSDGFCSGTFFQSIVPILRPSSTVLKVKDQ